MHTFLHWFLTIDSAHTLSHTETFFTHEGHLSWQEVRRPRWMVSQPRWHERMHSLLPLQFLSQSPKHFSLFLRAPLHASDLLAQAMHSFVYSSAHLVSRRAQTDTGVHLFSSAKHLVLCLQTCSPRFAQPRFLMHFFASGTAHFRGWWHRIGARCTHLL